MKEDLCDIVFLILVRLDSIERLENILVVTDTLLRYFKTNIYVLEADSYNNGLLKKLLNRKINYRFVEDKDPVLHKTKYYNQMAKIVKTPFMAIWDTDIITDKSAICDAVKHLREEADVAFPFNGICYETSEIIRNLYLEKKDIRLLHRHKDKLHLLYEHPLVGCALFVRTNKYFEAGGDNEKIYGWGNDDFCRYEQWIIHSFKIYHTNGHLYHLCHPRGINSRFRTSLSKKLSYAELYKLKHTSRDR